MKQILLTYFVILTSSFLTNAQDLVLTNKIERDSISIKWLPNNFDQFKSISNGATVSRIEASKNEDYKKLDFSAVKTWNIDPIKNRYESIDISTTEGRKIEDTFSANF